jgi:hypothetical protein
MISACRVARDLRDKQPNRFKTIDPSALSLVRRYTLVSPDEIFDRTNVLPCLKLAWNVVKPANACNLSRSPTIFCVVSSSVFRPVAKSIDANDVEDNVRGISVSQGLSQWTQNKGILSGSYGSGGSHD